MRLRNIPGSRETIAENQWCIQNPEQNKDNWHSVFGNNNPIHIEIGMGKGSFILSLAENNPDINYVGIEKYSSVLLRALQKLDDEANQQTIVRKNIKFIRMDAEDIHNVFGKSEVERIYLNFSDPWPKDRHAKRRLTSRQFLERYHQFLSSTGTIEFKTDNRDLFDFSLIEIKDAGWNLKAFTRDLHNDTVMFEGNVMTEYEERFSSMGNPIYKLITDRN